MSLQDLTIESVDGPTPIALHAGGRNAIGIGRQTDCLLRLDHAAVSRSHALLSRHAGQWFLSDLGSRHGTLLNGRPVEPGAGRPIFNGDLITIRPWTLRCSLGGESTFERRIATRDDRAGQDMTIAVFDRADVRAPVGRLLHLLTRATERIGAAQGEEGVRELVLEALLEGTGLERAALLRALPESGSADVLSCRPEEEADNLPVSRTLLKAAREGQIATMCGSGTRTGPALGQTLMEAGVHTALCAPAGEGVFVYADARAARAPIERDVAAFCGALAGLYALAESSLRRADAERRSARLNAELDAAREVQRRLVPPDRGRCAGADYACVMRPGVVVAGDLFDIADLGDGHVGFFLGDVTGKGVGPSLTMAAAQASLHLALTEHRNPARAARAVNRFIAERSEAGLFATCWIGVLDTRARTLQAVDAGHGYAIFVSESQGARTLRADGGLPLGVDPEADYRAETIPLTPGDRVVLFSDGVAEQTDATGAQFGLERALQAIARARNPAEDVEHLSEAVRTFAAGVPQGDDLTIGSIQLA